MDQTNNEPMDSDMNLKDIMDHFGIDAIYKRFDGFNKLFKNEKGDLCSIKDLMSKTGFSVSVKTNFRTERENKEETIVYYDKHPLVVYPHEKITFQSLESKHVFKRRCPFGSVVNCIFQRTINYWGMKKDAINVPVKNVLNVEWCGHIHIDPCHEDMQLEIENDKYPYFTIHDMPINVYESVIDLPSDAILDSKTSSNFYKHRTTKFIFPYDRPIYSHIACCSESDVHDLMFINLPLNMNIYNNDSSLMIEDND